MTGWRAAVLCALVLYWVACFGFYAGRAGLALCFFP